MNYLANSDEEVMRAYQQGQAIAFEEIFRRYKKSVFSYILRYTGNQQDSEEIFQHVFVKMHRATPTWQPTAKFSTWLFTIVRNLCIDHHRKQRLRKNISMDDTFGEDSDRTLHDTLAFEGSGADEKNSDAQIRQILEEALKTINDDQREVFLMREKSGLKFEEIAEVLGVSVNTVKSRMRYAMEALRKYIEKSRFKELNPLKERSFIK